MSVERYTAADIADFAAHRHEEFVNAKDYDAAEARAEAAEQGLRELLNCTDYPSAGWVRKVARAALAGRGEEP